MAARTVAELAEQVKTDDALLQRMKTDPEAALRAEAVYTSDQTFYRIAILGLIGIIFLVIVAAVVIQVADDAALPDWIAALATVALGGLVGLFAPSPSSG